MNVVILIFGLACLALVWPTTRSDRRDCGLPSRAERRDARRHKS